MSLFRARPLIEVLARSAVDAIGEERSDEAISSPPQTWIALISPSPPSSAAPMPVSNSSPTIGPEDQRPTTPLPPSGFLPLRPGEGGAGWVRRFSAPFEIPLRKRLTFPPKYDIFLPLEGFRFETFCGGGTSNFQMRRQPRRTAGAKTRLRQERRCSILAQALEVGVAANRKRHSGHSKKAAGARGNMETRPLPPSSRVRRWCVLVFTSCKEEHT